MGTLIGWPSMIGDGTLPGAIETLSAKDHSHGWSRANICQLLLY
jgi:hypothetical protein